MRSQRVQVETILKEIFTHYAHSFLYKRVTDDSTEDRPPTNQQHQQEHEQYTMPVDLLLYLANRDHETYASLIATEGNRVNWWSTTAIGTPIG